MEDTRVLFILKKRQEYSNKTYAGHYFSSGLYWSAKFVADMLDELGYIVRLVEVTDNNDIDREVTKFQPDVVIIEALWVVPEKFDVLKALHPAVRWIVRIHSNIPFLASEGVAIEWIKGYVERGVQVAVNEKRALRDLRAAVPEQFQYEVIYLPNFYPVGCGKTQFSRGLFLHVGCYGAIRPLKNQLLQAVAAMRYADQTGQVLFFHINATRVEHGDSELKNLRALFDGTPHILSEDSWMSHEDFINSLRILDVGMQVSLSETFSIVAADMVSVGIPIVVSPEVDWASSICKVNPTDSEDIQKGLARALEFPKINVTLNRRALNHYDSKTRTQWTAQF